MTSETLKTKLISIDAWGNARDGWEWNDMHTLEEDILWVVDDENPMATRRILRKLREWNYLNEISKGRVIVEDDGYNYVVMDRKTFEPLLALCYGEFL